MFNIQFLHLVLKIGNDVFFPLHLLHANPTPFAPLPIRLLRVLGNVLSSNFTVWQSRNTPKVSGQNHVQIPETIFRVSNKFTFTSHLNPVNLGNF